MFWAEKETREPGKTSHKNDPNHPNSTETILLQYLGDSNSWSFSRKPHTNLPLLHRNVPPAHTPLTRLGLRYHSQTPERQTPKIFGSGAAYSLIIKLAVLNPWVDQFWPSGHMFVTPGLDRTVTTVIQF